MPVQFCFNCTQKVLVFEICVGDVHVVVSVREAEDGA